MWTPADASWSPRRIAPFFCPRFKQITTVRDELMIAAPAPVDSAAALRNCERHHRRCIRNPVSDPSHASNHSTRIGIRRRGSIPCHAAPGIGPSKCACGRMQQYQSRKASRGACSWCLFATCQQSCDCFSVPKKRSTIFVGAGRHGPGFMKMAPLFAD